MKWLLAYARSSIGRKQAMAVTGLGFCGFLGFHLMGNLTMYGGKGFFQSYADLLHSTGPIVLIAELGMLALAAVHVGSAALGFWGNWTARGHRYAVKSAEGGRTISSATMPYTGVLILGFVIIHLLNFTFVDKTLHPISLIVATTLAQPAYLIFYLGLMVVVGLHVRHGFWSAFQTLGASHPRYTPLVEVGSVLFGIALAVGFGSLPILVMRGGLDF